MTERFPFPWAEVGHSTDETGLTGCTVMRFRDRVVASGEVRGGAPATREFALLEPTRLVESIDAVCLSGGSAFGLAAVDGVVRSLHADGAGFRTAHGNVPIVVGLSLYDLGVGESTAWPDATSGSAALDACGPDFEVGQVGAGTGATTGKWRGPLAVTPGGVGFAVASKGDVRVAALLAVNAVGEITDSGHNSSAAIVDGSFEWPEPTSPLGGEHHDRSHCHQRERRLRHHQGPLLDARRGGTRRVGTGPRPRPWPERRRRACGGRKTRGRYRSRFRTHPLRCGGRAGRAVAGRGRSLVNSRRVSRRIHIAR